MISIAFILVVMMQPHSFLWSNLAVVVLFYLLDLCSHFMFLLHFLHDRLT